MEIRAKCTGTGPVGRWIKNVLVGFDQLANAFAGGDPDETISSRCGKRERSSRFCRWLCGMLNKLDRRHCAESIELDEGEPFTSAHPGTPR